MRRSSPSRRSRPGQPFTRDNIWVKRPGTGSILAIAFENVLGKRAVRDLAADIQADRPTSRPDLTSSISAERMITATRRGRRFLGNHGRLGPLGRRPQPWSPSRRCRGRCSDSRCGAASRRGPVLCRPPGERRAASSRRTALAARSRSLERSSSRMCVSVFAPCSTGRCRMSVYALLIARSIAMPILRAVWATPRRRRRLLRGRQARLREGGARCRRHGAPLSQRVRAGASRRAVIGHSRSAGGVRTRGACAISHRARFP